MAVLRIDHRELARAAALGLLQLNFEVTTRDSGLVAKLFDERDPAVKKD